MTTKFGEEKQYLTRIQIGYFGPYLGWLGSYPLMVTALIVTFCAFFCQIFEKIWLKKVLDPEMHSNCYGFFEKEKT